jgi:hypothetical protein
MSRPHHDDHPPTDAPAPSPPPPGDVPAPRRKPLRQDAQEAALEVQLAQKAGCPR